jgi:hypothetical protein
VLQRGLMPRCGVRRLRQAFGRMAMQVMKFCCQKSAA